MPFNCDVCGKEVPYSSKKFFSRYIIHNGLNVVMCDTCLKKKVIQLEDKNNE